MATFCVQKDMYCRRKHVGESIYTGSNNLIDSKPVRNTTEWKQLECLITVEPNKRCAKSILHLQ